MNLLLRHYFQSETTLTLQNCRTAVGDNCSIMSLLSRFNWLKFGKS